MYMNDKRGMNEYLKGIQKCEQLKLQKRKP